MELTPSLRVEVINHLSSSSEQESNPGALGTLGQLDSWDSWTPLHQKTWEFRPKFKRSSLIWVRNFKPWGASTIVGVARRRLSVAGFDGLWRAS